MPVPVTALAAAAALAVLSLALGLLALSHRARARGHMRRAADLTAQVGELGRINRALRTRAEQHDTLEGKVRSTERAAASGESRSKLILEHAPIGIVTLDREGRFLTVNAAFASMTGHAAGRLAGKWFFDLVDREHLPRVMGLLDRVLRGEKGVVRADLDLVRADRRVLETVVRAAPVRTQKEGLSTVIVQVEDVTAERAAQRALERHAQALERRNRELAQFAHLFAHDLQEPLRDVTSYVQLLHRRLQPVLDAEGREYIAYAAAGAERAKRLLLDVLTYTDLDARKLDASSVEVGAALDDALARLGGIIATTNARVTAGELPVVAADRALLTDLLAELVGNAIKFHGPGPASVRVEAEREPAAWLVRVRDDGPGIDEAYRDKVFGIFKRLAGRDVPGSGMGLALARKIVERHGGRIWFEEPGGPGASVAFTLPDAGPPALDGAAASASAELANA